MERRAEIKEGVREAISLHPKITTDNLKREMHAGHASIVRAIRELEKEGTIPSRLRPVHKNAQPTSWTDAMMQIVEAFDQYFSTIHSTMPSNARITLLRPRSPSQIASREAFLRVLRRIKVNAAELEREFEVVSLA